MNNDELKNKIVEILFPVLKGKRVSCNEENACERCWFPCEVDRLADSLADALIAAGIGDVSELKNHRVVAEYSLIPEDGNSYVLPNTQLRITQLYSGEEVEKIVKERKELKDELRSKVEYIHEQDEVIKEYKHRAEVAERALDKATELAYTYRTQDDTLSCSSCPFDSIFDRCKERGLYEDCSKRWKEELLQQAEKELAEEGKDEN